MLPNIRNAASAASNHCDVRGTVCVAWPRALSHAADWLSGKQAFLLSAFIKHVHSGAALYSLYHLVNINIIFLSHSLISIFLSFSHSLYNTLVLQALECGVAQ